VPAVRSRFTYHPRDSAVDSVRTRALQVSDNGRRCHAGRFGRRIGLSGWRGCLAARRCRR